MAFFGAPLAAADWPSGRIAETHFAGGAFLPRHRHDEAYITFVLSGGYREHTSAETRDCGPLTVVLHPAGDTHEDQFEQKPTRCLNVVCAESFVKRLGDAASALDRARIVSELRIALIGERISAELRRPDDSSPIIVEGLLLELFGLLSRSEEPSKTPAWLAAAHAIVARTFMHRPSLGKIADEVGIHPTHLARAFRQKYGMTIGDQVRVLRISYACERIAAGASLTLVAQDAGFADQSHFTRTFTRMVGVSPAEYRRRLR